MTLPHSLLRLCLLTFAIASVLLAGTADARFIKVAKIYKYTDQNGNVVYSSTKPPRVEAKELKPRVQKVSPDAARKQLDALGERANSPARNRELVEKGKEESDAIAKREAENCEQARKNLEVLKTSARVQAPDASGNLFFLDEEAVKAKTAEAQEQIKRYCK